MARGVAASEAYEHVTGTHLTLIDTVINGR